MFSPDLARDTHNVVQFHNFGLTSNNKIEKQITLKFQIVATDCEVYKFYVFGLCKINLELKRHVALVVLFSIIILVKKY